jgi:hypothetical protein
MFLAAGLQLPGSPALKPLCGLASTLLKAGNPTQVQSVVITATVAAECIQAVWSFNSLLLQAVCAGSSGRDSSVDSRSGSRSGSSSADAVLRVLDSSMMHSVKCYQWLPEALSTIVSSSSTASGGSSDTSPDAVALVPWLVCLGRCCLGYARQLQLNTSAEAPAARFRSHKQLVEDMGQALQEVSTVLPGWLQSSSVSAQLSAVGYDTQSQVEPLHTAALAQQHASQAGAPALAQLLVRLGLALSSLPVSSTQQPAVHHTDRAH